MTDCTRKSKRVAGPMRADLTASQVRVLLDYEQGTGTFIWKTRGGASANPWNARFAGKVAGRQQEGRKGLFYERIAIGGVSYLSHRLAWLYMTGEWPQAVIDHINGNGLDNRIENLRAATRAENNRNSRVKSNNTTGYKGVCFDRREGRFVASIARDGKQFNLGYFETPEDAHAAYCIAAERLHGKFARTR